MSEKRERRSICLAALLLALAWPARALGEAVTFLAIDQDPETGEADKKLRTLLEPRLDQGLSPKSYGYEAAIRTLADWGRQDSGGRFLARLTPYVYITAEMLGADMELLGTYHSKATGETTYHSYFVVHRGSFPGMEAGEVELRHLLAFLREAERPRFLYHDRFSTSSYFLPSLFFRAHRIFNMEQANDRLTAIESRMSDERSSTHLVKQVAAGQADFAAVWDGTKSKFEPGGEHQDLGRQVLFIRLPTPLPNDLLVCSPDLDSAAKESIRQALAGSGDQAGLAIGRGDFERWVDIDEAPDAREALGDLRWLAHEAPAPVTVRISAAESDPADEWHLGAARQAIRLSGTEFVLYDGSFHRQVDFEWRLRLIREGYLGLESDIPDVQLSQDFHISFRPGHQEDLAARINRTLHARIHRVRYLWPYEKEHPLVIRDVLFSLPPESDVKIQRIRWLDPQRNDYAAMGTYDVKIKSSDNHKFTIRDEDLHQLTRNPEKTFDPMSNVAHRVILVRPEQPRAMFRVFDGVLWGLLAASVLGTVLTRRGKAA